MKGLYYTAPSVAFFNEMKAACTEVWKGMDNTYGYVDEKLARIKDIQNIEDNFMYMLAMFDQDNQRKVISQLSPATKDAVRERMIDGGNSEVTLILMGL